MSTFKIAVLPGDGIGQEVTAEAVRVLRAVAKGSGTSFEFESALVGGGAIDAAGTPLPAETLKLCKASHAILFGSVGGPKWDHLPQEQRAERGLLALRKELDLYANLRPATCFPMLVDASPLKRSVVEGTDIMVIRELTGGLYFGEPRGRTPLAGGGERGVNTMVYTTPRDRAGGPRGLRGGAQAPQAPGLGRQGQRSDRVPAVAGGRHPGRPRLSRRDAGARSGRQLRHGPGAQAHPLRHDRDREHVRGHPVGRGGNSCRVPWGCCRPPRWGWPGPGAETSACTSPYTAPPPTSPGRGSPTPSRRFCRRRCS